MADTAQQAATVKAICANIDAGAKALQKVAGNLVGLLTAGKATCDDIKAYNMGAYALYQTQLAMVQAARTAGDATGLPSVSYPTYFTWKGTGGININCNTATNSLNGALAAAMAPPGPATVYLSTDQINIVNGKKPEVSGTMPSYSEILAAQQGQLGLAFIVWVVIAGAAVYLGVRALEYLFDYLKESEIQEQSTARNVQLLEGYATQTQGRLACYTQCMSKAGNSDAGCTEVCAKLVTAPPVLATGRLDPNSGLGILGTIGLIALAAGGGVLAWKYVRKDHAPRTYSAGD